MEMTIISVGLTLIKTGVLGGMVAGMIAGVTWFGKYNPKFKGNRGGGIRDESDTIENLRSTVRH